MTVSVIKREGTERENSTKKTEKKKMRIWRLFIPWCLLFCNKIFVNINADNVGKQSAFNNNCGLSWVEQLGCRWVQRGTQEIFVTSVFCLIDLSSLICSPFATSCNLLITWWLLSRGILETQVQKSRWVKNLNLFHSQESHDQPVGVETKKRISWKTKENVDVHIQLHRQEAMEHCISHHFKDYWPQDSLSRQLLWEAFRHP